MDTMWITGVVDVPDELLEALDNGELVIFVGAGVSMDDPSNLPGFNELADQIAAGFSSAKRQNAAADQFLSDLRDQGVDVHKHAADIVGAASSKHNRNHSALVQLAALEPGCRIVTTNYDLHLTSAASGLGLSFAVYTAPALPLGHDFQGIVHIHGALTGQPRSLVLTDTDFGRAYLTEAWAARFLNDLFHRYVVLFIGYSHEDVVMTYLARGLNASRSRFAFVSGEDTHDWKRLGIIPVTYPSSGRDHTALTELLEAWERRASMGALAHRERVRQLVSGRPPLAPVENDYLSRSLQSGVGARAFADSAGPEWLEWVAETDTFRQGLSDVLRPGEPSSLLVGWFVRNFVSRTEGVSHGLDILRRTSQSPLGDDFVWAVTAALSASDATNRLAVGTWLATLSEHLRSGGTAPIEHLLKNLRFPEDLDVAAVALDILLTPHISLRESFAFGSDEIIRPPRAEVTWRTDAYELREFWLSATADGARDIFADAATRSLLLAHALLRAYTGQESSDFMSWSRPAVETHAQNGDELQDLLVEVLRDQADRVGRGPGAEGLQSAWWGSGSKLLRRLAVYLEGVRSDHDSDARVRWLLEKRLVHDFEVKHEVFWLLSREAASLSRETTADLMTAVLDAPSFGTLDADGHHRDYLIYNILIWLVGHAPDLPGAQSALDEIRAKYPDFLPREHPDFDSYVTSGTWHDRPPASMEDFRTMVKSDVSGALQWLQAQEYSNGDFDAPSAGGASQMLASLAGESALAGVSLWRAAGDQDATAVDVRAAILGGWRSSHLDAEQWDAVLGLVSEMPTTREQELGLARLLQVAVAESQPDDDVAERAADIATSFWQGRADKYTTQNAPTLSLGLNSWPGMLAQFWITYLQRRWQSDRDGWHGIPDERREAVLALVHAHGDSAKAAHPVLAADFYFLFAADEVFAQTQMFPLFSRDLNGFTVEGVWEAFVHGPRLDDRMIEAGFLNILLEGATIVESLSQHLFNNYCFLLVSALLYAGVTENQRSHVLESVFRGSTKLRATIVELLVSKVSELEPSKSAELWDSWIGEWLSARLQGAPIPLDSAELIRWNAIYPAIPERTRLVISALVAGAAPVTFRLRPRDHTSLQSLAVSDSISTIQYLEHLLRHCSGSSAYDLERLENTVRALVLARGTDALHPVVDRIVALGCPTAETWLRPEET